MPREVAVLGIFSCAWFSMDIFPVVAVGAASYVPEIPATIIIIGSVSAVLSERKADALLYPKRTPST